MKNETNEVKQEGMLQNKYEGYSCIQTKVAEEIIKPDIFIRIEDSAICIEKNNAPREITQSELNELPQAVLDNIIIMMMIKFNKNALSNLLLPKYTLQETINATDRQVSFWSEKGLFDEDDRKERQRRKFSISELAVYKILSEAKEFNISPSQLKGIKDNYLNKGQIVSYSINNEPQEIFLPNISLALIKAAAFFVETNLYLRIYKDIEGNIACYLSDLITLETKIFTPNHPIGKEVFDRPYIQINLNRLWSEILPDIVIRPENLALLSNKEKAILNHFRASGDKDITVEKRKEDLKFINETFDLLSEEDKYKSEEELQQKLADTIANMKAVSTQTIRRDGRIVNVKITKTEKLED